METEYEALDVDVVLANSRIGGMIVKETKKAYLIDFYGGVEEWIPKSQCTLSGGNPPLLEVEEWLGRIIEEKLGEAY